MSEHGKGTLVVLEKVQSPPFYPVIKPETLFMLQLSSTGAERCWGLLLTEKNPKPPLQVPMTLCRLTELANAPQAGPEEKMIIQGNDSLGLGNDQAKPVTEEHLTASLCVSAHLHLLSFNSIYHGIVTVRKKSKPHSGYNTW